MRLFPFALLLIFPSVFALASVEGTPGSPPDSPKVLVRDLPGFSVLGGVGLLPAASPTITYGGWWSPPNDGINQNKLTLQVPVYRDETELLSLSAGATSLHFGDAQTLSDSGIGVPLDFWKTEIGAAYSHRLVDEKHYGARLSVGSASDHPFSRLDVTTVGASGYYSWATSERSRWMVSVFFSNNNPIANYFPIPGVAYIYQTPTFTGLFGFPFSSMTWLPAPDWMIALSLFGPAITSEVAYGDPKGSQAFVNFSWLPQSFLREGRPDPTDRLYFDEKRVSLGTRFPVCAEVKGELAGGYAFDRSVYEGTHLRSKDNGSASIGAAWFIGWNFRMAL